MQNPNAIVSTVVRLHVVAALCFSSCQPPAKVVPGGCYELRVYRVFIPTPEVVCPEPQKVFEEFRKRQDDFNDQHPRATPFALERAFLDEFVGGGECVEVWAEKWTTVTCDNQKGKCLLDAPDFWECDHGAIPPGKLPEESGLPHYLFIDPPKVYPCGIEDCNGEQPPPALRGIRISNPETQSTEATE